MTTVPLSAWVLPYTLASVCVSIGWTLDSGNAFKYLLPHPRQYRLPPAFDSSPSAGQKDGICEVTMCVNLGGLYRLSDVLVPCPWRAPRASPRSLLAVYLSCVTSVPDISLFVHWNLYHLELLQFEEHSWTRHTHRVRHLATLPRPPGPHRSSRVHWPSCLSGGVLHVRAYWRGHYVVKQSVR